MKNSLLLFALILLFSASCKKEEKCPSCSLIVVNTTDYQVVLTLDSKLLQVMPGLGTYMGTIDSDKAHRLQGDLKSPYAHTDYDQMIQCDGACGTITVSIKH